jgi:hypothetical protein
VSLNTMKTNHTDYYHKSQRKLAASVLKQAQQDLRRFHAAPSAIERELYLDAYSWVMSEDYTWPFSFLQVCDSLDLAPEDVRQDLIGQLSQGTFSRWLHRYGRTIRRLRMLCVSVSPSRRRMKTAEPTTLVQTFQ